jgi:signal transduction histidine kinase
MKLLTRTTLYFIPVTLIVLGLGGFVFFDNLKHYTKEDANERLLTEKQRVLSYVAAYNHLPVTSLAFGDTVSFNEIPSAFEERKMKDTILYNSAEKELEPYRMIKFPVLLNGRYYRATIAKPLVESDDLTKAISESLLIIAAILLVVLTVFNFILTKTAWRPFYSSLEKLGSFDLTKGGQQITFDKTNTSEFSQLNSALSVMTSKISSDYKSLKEFTENASHELQTPLSVIQSKLELLIQSENLSPGQVDNVKAIYESANKLSRLNQALLLLTKIENRQFAETKEVSLDQLIERKLELFSELIEHKKLSIEKKLSPINIKAHPTLADILITNLLGNAIKHNIEGGKLGIETGNRQMVIFNSGSPISGSSEDLFARFKKANPSSDSLGLGLAIVKEICDVYGYNIRYDYSDGIHKMTLDF